MPTFDAMTKLWLLSTLERAGKTFVQVYLTFWAMAAGLGNGPVDDYGVNVDAFDLLFTMNNLKAAVVGTVFSFITSGVSTPLGPDKNSPSLVVTETRPAITAVAA